MRKIPVLLLSISVLFCAFFLSCKKDREEPMEHSEKEEKKTFQAVYTRDDIKESQKYGFSEGNVLSQYLDEASGLACGRKNRQVVYTHEDSSNRPEVYVYDEKANYLGKMRLNGVHNIDWEDMAIGPGPVEGEYYIYVGDIGDNRGVYDSRVIYRFPEPDLEGLEIPFDIEIHEFDHIRYQYPDGARDAETLMIDPSNLDLIIITKREVNVHVYSLPYPYDLSGMNESKFHGTLPLRMITAGDISADGKKILIKDLGAVYYYERKEEAIIPSLFHVIPKSLPYIPEVKGEAIAWSYDASAYFTLTEAEGRVDPVLYKYVRK